MTSKMTFSALLERNRALIPNHKPLITVAEMVSGVSTPPKIIIITCADPRCTPEHFLNLTGTEAIVIRNVAGHVAPAIKDIVVLDGLLPRDEVCIIHHTDCGGLLFEDETIRDILRERVPGINADRMQFGAITK